MKFKVGDVVQLKTGGPKMTVESILNGTVIRNGIIEHPVICIRIDESSNKWSDQFVEDCLELCQDIPKSLSQHEFIVKFREEVRPLIDKLSNLSCESVYGLRGAMGFTCPDNEVSRGLQILRYAFIYLIKGAIEQKIDIPERFYKEEETK